MALLYKLKKLNKNVVHLFSCFKNKNILFQSNSKDNSFKTKTKFHR